MKNKMASSSSTSSFMLALLFISTATSPVTSSRPLHQNHLSASASTFVARLKLDEDPSSSSCSDSLFQVQACAGEVILFFMSGETYLGKPCCKAIRTIEHDCWPDMLTSLGYSEEEGFVLQGYCDGVKDVDPLTPVHDHAPPSLEGP